MVTTEHLKMMRLLFLCLLLLLPAATAVSEEDEGSADGGLENDDEDLYRLSKRIPDVSTTDYPGSLSDKATGEEGSDQLTMIIIIVAVTALTLSVAVIVVIMLVRRHMHKRQQGVYSVPTEQDQKGAV
ncbi:uncharacterized protein si:dkey-262k9.2 isoform X2 [Dicentrarchus labrax]|uniref:uncharacterized protein si:dkey-262k9.2 isoform X2 n=1 Tax=Dicentrarchus labrax TaxID=13489 RepID=UPI0021F59701|nr:uncharacterized protein si:dkey-262k9.2 isoform X2 [Dicentrarchus labrax]